MKLITLFVRYGMDYKDSHLYLMDSLMMQLPNTICDLIIIDTSLPENNIEKNKNGITILGSSNTNREFGGWQRAITYLGNYLFNYDYVLLATSALKVGYIEFQKYLTEEILHKFMNRPVVMGHIEVYNEYVTIINIKFQAWIRSSYIILPVAELSLLGNLVTFNNPDLFFSYDYKKPFKENAPLNSQFKKNIVDWLTGEGLGQGTTWHSRFDLSVENFDFFKKKAMAIFNETILSQRFEALGMDIIDLTWLHGHLHETIIPRWYEQVVTRGTGHEFIIEK